jgi:hypothetical protein
VAARRHRRRDAVKLNPRDEYGEFYWVAHPDGIGGGYNGNTKEIDTESMLVSRRYDLEIIGGIHDEEANYSYDDWVLCELDGRYYLLATSGCSCPSPSETWRLEIGPATLADIRAHVTSGQYEGYTVPGRQMAEFLALIDSAEKGAAP